MRRTVGLGLLAAFVMEWSWLRLEHGEVTWSLLFWSIAIGVLPALLPTTRLRLAAVPVAALFGLHHALGTARPGEAWNRIVDGFYLLLRRAAALQRRGTSAHARTRPPRGVRLHPRDLARYRRAPRAARNRTAGRGSCLAGDAADELEHGGPRGRDPRGRARPPGGTLELGAPSAGLGRRGRCPRCGRPGLGHTGCREGRVSPLGEVGAFEQERPARSASATSGTRTTPRSRGPSARRRC